MRYLVGYYHSCGCVTAALDVRSASSSVMGDWMKQMIESGRCFRPSDDLSVEVKSCPHRQPDPTTKPQGE